MRAYKHILHVLFVALSIIIIYPFSTYGNLMVFGPEEFSRSRGRPVEVSRDFSVSQSLESTFMMTVINGSDNSNTRVSSAIIHLNGTTVFGPSDFNVNVGRITREVKLQRNNTLTVELRSRPNSFITLEINVDPTQELNQLEDFLIDELGNIQPPNFPSDLGLQIEISPTIVDEFRKFTEEAAIFQFGSFFLTAFMTPNEEAKTATRMLLNELNSKEFIDSNELLKVLDSHDIHAQDADAGSIPFKIGSEAQFIGPPYAAYDSNGECISIHELNLICLDTGILVTDDDTHSIHKDNDIAELISGPFIENNKLIDSALTMIHELIHALVFQTSCFSGSREDEEHLARQVEQLLAAKVEGNNALFEILLDDLLENVAGSKNCLDKLGYVKDSPHEPNLLHTFQSPMDNNPTFGGSLAVAGNNVFIGAYLDNSAAERDGAVYLFNGNTGELLRTFFHPQASTDSHFGWTIAAEGNEVLIGALSDDTAVPDGGAAFLFNHNTGQLLQTFKKSEPQQSDQCGVAVSIIGNRVYIGCINDDTAERDSGAVYVFDRTSGDILDVLTKPNPSSVSTFNAFGAALAPLGDNILVGDTTHQRRGAVFYFDGQTGSLLQTFLDPTGIGLEDALGISITTVGSTVVAGAPQSGVNSQGHGEVHLYNSMTGDHIRTLVPPNDPNPVSERFGRSVASFGCAVIIGSPMKNGTFGHRAVYLFDSETGDLLQTVQEPMTGLDRLFGNAVSDFDSTVLVGAPAASSVSGAVYQYDPGIGVPNCR